MSYSIHPTAVVSPTAHLGEDVSIGPYCVVEDDVILGDRCQLSSRAVIKTGTVLGTENEIAEGAVIGGAPQHARRGLPHGGLCIGHSNRFRENVTAHCALEPGNHTLIGDHNLVMVNAHVGHDVKLGSHTIIVNNVMIGGHGVVEDRAYLGGGAGVHQFCRVGQFAMVGAQSHIVQDVPPFVTVDGATSRVVGLNRVGLRRFGFDNGQLLQLKEAYRVIFRMGLTWPEVMNELASRFPTGPAASFLPFIAAGKRGFVPERRLPRRATIKLPSADDRDFIDHQFRRAG